MTTYELTDGQRQWLEHLQRPAESGAALSNYALQLLAWDRSGFIVGYKRLEREKFHWPVRAMQMLLTLSGEQLNWLLDGYDFWRIQPHQALNFSHVSRGCECSVREKK
jgi:hypothetical protein